MNMMLANSAKTPAVIQAEIDQSATKQYVSDVPIFELASRAKEDASKLQDDDTRDMLDLTGLTDEELQSVIALIQTGTVVADASLQGECFWDGSGEGDAITLQLLCRQRRSKSECDSIRCKWIALLALDEEDDSEVERSGSDHDGADGQQKSEIDEMDLNPSDSEDIDDDDDGSGVTEDESGVVEDDDDDESNVTDNDIEIIESLSEDDDESSAVVPDEDDGSSAMDNGLEIESDSEDTSSSSSSIESEGIGAQQMELKDAADQQVYDVDSGSDSNSDSDSDGDSDFESADVIDLEDPAHSVQRVYLDQMEDGESADNENGNEGESEVAESEDVINAEDSTSSGSSKQHQFAEADTETDTDRSSLSSGTSSSSDSPNTEDFESGETDDSQREHVDSVDTETDEVKQDESSLSEDTSGGVSGSQADRYSNHRNQRAQSQSIHAHDDPQDGQEDIDLVADSKSTFVSADCVWDGTGSVDGATMTAFCNSLQERECVASDSGRKEGRCMWNGRVHSQMSGVSGVASNHYDPVETESNEQRQSGDHMSSDARSKPTELGCVWDGSGCTGGCSREEMTARCILLSQAQEDCESEHRCVWSHSQEDMEQQLLDHRIESVVNFKLSVLDIVLGLVSFISIVFALNQLRHWWTNREYNEVKDEMEPLLVDTV